MEITLESIAMNRKQYNANIEKILQDRTELMKQVTELRKRKEQITDTIEIARLEFEETGLIQQINDLTYSYKSNKLTLEQLQIQQDALEKKINNETYSLRISANRDSKGELYNEQELAYYENEISKCEKAIELYTLLGEKDNIEKWQKNLEKAQKYLEIAQDEVNKNEKSNGNNVARTDKEEVTTDEVNVENNNGHTLQVDEKGSMEKWKNVVKDDSNIEIGTREAVEIEEYATGKKLIDVTTELENKDGKYTIREHSEGAGDDYETQKTIIGFNKKTGNNEKFYYSKDQDGNEFAYSEINGKTGLRVSKTSRGTTIDIYDENGQIKDSFEYDSEGKAIMGFEGLDELPEDYVEKFIQRTARNIPNYYIEDMQQEKDEQQSILDSAIEATEDNTRTGEINEEVQNIKRRQKEKEQQQSIENNGVNR